MAENIAKNNTLKPAGVRRRLDLIANDGLILRRDKLSGSSETSRAVRTRSRRVETIEDLLNGNR